MATIVINKYKNSVVDSYPDSIGSADSDQTAKTTHNNKKLRSFFEEQDFFSPVSWRLLLNFKVLLRGPSICHFLTEKK
jgi:hypothetical protein